MALNETGATWIQNRGLDLELAIGEGLHSASPEDSSDNAPFDWVAFPYEQNGKRVGCKYRWTVEKKFSQDKGSRQCLYRIDKLAGAKTIVICEGEMDALSAIMGGYNAATTVPGGAPQESGRKAHEYFYDARHILEKAESIILSFDNDGPGAALFEDALAALGRARCRFVEYPEGCKDLNEVLMLYGAGTVKRLLDEAPYVPVDGIFRPSQLPQLPDLEVHRAGLSPEFDKHVGIVKGQTSVWTGFANHGKSLLLRQVATALAKNDGWVIAGAFMEDDYQRHFKLDILRAYSGYHPSAVKPEVRTAFEQFYEDHWRLIAPPEDETVRMSWLFDRMETAVVRHGADFIVIDPFTEIDLELGRHETERDRIGEILTSLNRFARRFNVHIAIVAHPTKPSDRAERHPPLGYDVSGAAHWKNKPFLGVTVHKDPDVENYAQVVVWKSKRREEMGPTGQFVMKYDTSASVYYRALQSQYDDEKAGLASRGDLKAVS